MALSDTFLKLEIDTSYAGFSDLTSEALNSLVLHVGPGHIAFQPFQNAEYQQNLTSTLGHAGRVSADPISLVIGAKAPYFMPLNQWGLMNLSQVQELSQLIKKGVVTATLHNRGETVGGSGLEWRVGFNVDDQEIRSYSVQPRSVWEAVTASQSVPAAGADNFIYIPGTPRVYPIIECQEATTVDYDIQVYAFNPISNAVALIAEFLNRKGTFVERLNDVEYSQYIIPIVSRVGGVVNIDVNVGLQIERA